ncbi:MAG TPA: 16S rRNA (adenine(1518)-N(6)/adenine(1519)-N(6))-dimethyltransferase RsmA [Patescibacteria group bacterium]|nr:16S rRNA (adenine(1518)-N(6)/adenine(1519)-N(6))-dimethyltransferase RsmA [Patescibacteria group bacterium]
MEEVFSLGLLKSLSERFHLRPTREYGQNFLLSAQPIRSMLAAAKITPSDTIVEVGPGFGVLTFALAEVSQQVVAFEIEKKLLPYWEEKRPENVKIIWGNALTNWSKQSQDWGQFKLIANIPYQITARLLRTVLANERKPELIIIMVQREVAERICAQPGKMSLLSASVQYYGQPRIITRVSKENFWPKPKVDSAVLGIFNIHGPEQEEEKNFFRLLRAGFSQPRKMLLNNLKGGLPLPVAVLRTALNQCGLDEKVRAETLSVTDWRALSKLLF